MSKKDELIDLFNEKYGVDKSEISGETQLSDIIGSDTKFSSYLEERFDDQPSSSEELNFLTVDDVVAWLER
ncbi:hypothetical protein [Pseudomonas auratipiscis]|uniref:Acyl carrier protein n=1 Tax=Pseudomonas auratipiscis TaxID=3115853 RepID=A0AB35WXS0_9PSED|nr:MULTISPECIES: hypothetical protein [unclassified Pseudomonas]MEE1867830.1 hypothetical protein [Pseudomonas sp. 120P]MEE1960306.1 hypothetical protein [Pseudomonas sp. 119P]